MNIKSSGVVFTGECQIQTPYCVALTPAPITAVWGTPSIQINVCRPCLEEMVRRGEWNVAGARIEPRVPMAKIQRQLRLRRLPGGDTL